MSAVAPYFRDLLHLDATQTALLVIVPFVRGSLARISHVDACRSREPAHHPHRADARGHIPNGTRSYSLELPHPAVRDTLSWTCGFPPLRSE